MVRISALVFFCFFQFLCVFESVFSQYVVGDTVVIYDDLTQKQKSYTISRQLVQSKDGVMSTTMHIYKAVFVDSGQIVILKINSIGEFDKNGLRDKKRKMTGSQMAFSTQIIRNHSFIAGTSKRIFVDIYAVGHPLYDPTAEESKNPQYNVKHSLNSKIEELRQTVVIMEFMEKSVEQHAQSLQTLDEKINFALEFVQFAKQALKEMMSLGFKHLDIKPKNILYVNGVFKIIDFDLSQMQGAKNRLSGYTENYAAPEFEAFAAKGSSSNGNDPAKYPALDLYSFAASTLELLVGKDEFHQLSQRVKAAKTVTEKQQIIETGVKVVKERAEYWDETVKENLSYIENFIVAGLTSNPSTRLTLYGKFYHSTSPGSSCDRLSTVLTP